MIICSYEFIGTNAFVNFKLGVKLMRKHFILSTRTLVSKRNVTQSFGEDNTIIVPMAVVDEIQKSYATQNSERGKIARETLEYLWSFDFKELTKGVKQKNGSILRVTTNYCDVQLDKTVSTTSLDLLDTRILQTCKGIKSEVPNSEPVILVSKSVALRMKAEMIGVKAQGFRDELLPELKEQYSGRMNLEVPDTLIELFESQRKLDVSQVVPEDKIKEVYENTFILLKGAYKKALGRIEKGYIVPLVFGKSTPFGVIPKNDAQRFMIEALSMDEEKATLVIFKGPAGTAKTFLSLAVGLQKVDEEGKYPNKILISRSPTETGEKLGFLPGDEGAKMNPYMRGIRDNLKQLLHPNDDLGGEQEHKTKRNRRCSFTEKPQYEDGSAIFTFGSISVEAINYIRGRSICDTFIIIDEAQNLTASEIKTIITRVGTGTKMVIIGDPEQIDRPELSERDNGLSYASERFKGEPRCWQLTLTEKESVRSELAKIASHIL